MSVPYKRNWRQKVKQIAEHELSEPSRLRMLITTVVVMNFVTLQMMFLYVTDLLPAKEALQTNVFFLFVAFAGYLVISRMHEIARTLQKVIA